MDLILYRSKFFKIIFKISFIVCICCCKIKTIAETNINLSITCLFRSTEVWWKTWTSHMSPYIICLSTNTILCCILDWHLSFNYWHIPWCKIFFLIKFMIYLVLIEIWTIVRNCIVYRWRSLMRTLNDISCFRIYNIRLSWLSNTETRLIFLLAIKKRFAHHFRITILARTHICLKCFESLLQLSHRCSTH